MFSRSAIHASGIVVFAHKARASFTFPGSPLRRLPHRLAEMAWPGRRADLRRCKSIFEHTFQSFRVTKNLF